MKLKNYLIITLICLLIICINYFTDFMFSFNSEFLIFIWTFVNVILFPLWLANYIYKVAELNYQKNLIFKILIAILAYLLTYIIPLLAYFDFSTFSLNGDGATVVILKGIMFFGLIFTSISSIIFHNKLKYNTSK